MEEKETRSTARAPYRKLHGPDRCHFAPVMNQYCMSLVFELCKVIAALTSIILPYQLLLVSVGDSL